MSYLIIQDKVQPITLKFSTLQIIQIGQMELVELMLQLAQTQLLLLVSQDHLLQMMLLCIFATKLHRALISHLPQQQL